MRMIDDEDSVDELTGRAMEGSTLVIDGVAYVFHGGWTKEEEVDGKQRQYEVDDPD